MATWLSLVQLVNLLPQALDKQLRDDAGVSHVYYQVLAMLSASPEGRLRMSELARHSATSQSRLSHAVSSLEEKGWVRRVADPQDRRGQLAELLPAGRDVLRRTAPGHVAEARRLVLDRLTREEVAQLGVLADRLLDGLVAPAARLRPSPRSTP
ncbi:MAG: MarR family transcriptional regulator [Frankiales bacterium]|nr:MarR family transcriptional regulator [Frankiales bacterium]